jgi:hypothetical protein
MNYAVARKDPRCRDINSLVDAARVIRGAMPLAPSIDNFIHAHNQNKAIELVGKLAIAESILAAERQSKIYFEPGRNGSKLDFRTAKGTWFNTFSQRLMERGTLDDLKRRLSNITFVVFNYDRCLEHYLFNAFKAYYNISREDSAELVKSIRILHPYGSVGGLWFSGRPQIVDFGEDCDPNRLLDLAGEIRTFTEGTELMSSHVTELRQCLERADQLVFLGFHFHPLNLDFLLPPAQRVPAQNRNYKAFATAKDFKADDQAVIRTNITRRFSDSVAPFFMEDCTCAELFDRNKVTLAFDYSPP